MTFNDGLNVDVLHVEPVPTVCAPWQRGTYYYAGRVRIPVALCGTGERTLALAKAFIECETHASCVPHWTRPSREGDIFAVGNTWYVVQSNGFRRVAREDR